VKIVIIDDQEEIRYSLAKILNREGYETIEFAGNEYGLVEDVVSAKPALVVIDVMLGVNISGIDLAREIQNSKLGAPIVLITAYTTPSNVIEASRVGVKDILQKPFEPDEFLEIVKRYAKTKRSKSQDLIFYEDDGEAFVGSFETMKSVYKKIGIAANNDLSVLIRGETGSGKELIAKMIHKSSDRASKPLIAVNCAAIPSELFESQFFGHERGAFTGADKQYIGLAEQAEDGTLFLDEIGELSVALQSKLLRFLETKIFRRVGGTKEIASKARIISATNIDLSRNVTEGLFREDLFYRLAMILIEVPPLSQRQSDIPALCNHFISKANKELKTNIKSISKDAIALLCSHEWSGNIREFRNTIYNAALNADGEIIGVNDIKLSRLSKKDGSALTPAICELLDEKGVEFGARAFEEIEKEFLKEFLVRCPNFSQAANHLEMSRNTLKAKLRKYGIYEKLDE
jgi:DNA-binding NtrC family response regulator